MRSSLCPVRIAGLFPRMDGRCLYIEAIAELRSHLEMKMSSCCFFGRSRAPAWSLQAQLWAGEGAPSLFAAPAERGQGLPHPQLRKWHRPPTSHSEETPGRPKGEAAKQRAPEQPVLKHLSLCLLRMRENTAGTCRRRNCRMRISDCGFEEA